MLVFASREDDANLAAQRAALAGSGDGMVERDLVLIVKLGPTANRSRYDVAAGEFAALLIGRDGGVKLRSRQPISADRLFREIDTMPMRQSEMRR